MSTTVTDADRHMMARALELASRGEGRTAPNPPVGAVIVRDGSVAGEGFHAKAGGPHAEVAALREAGERARGATIFVTLEPCAHHGRTPPCTEALIEAGIARVVIGCSDPNPRVEGGGARVLEAAGLDVSVGLEEALCRRLISPFAHHVTTGLPFTTLKSAVTLDGKTATSTGRSQWISGEAALQETHSLRNRVDAIMVGVGTVIEDDPKLTTRGVQGGRDPLRVVVDSRLRTPPEAAILHLESPAPTLVATTDRASTESITAIEREGVEVLVLGRDAEGRVDLGTLWKALGNRDILHLLLEGGATLAQAALEAQLIQRMRVVIAPKMLGGNDGFSIFRGQGVQDLEDAVRLRDLRARNCGGDIIIEGELERV
jgi:diaminohydroxyphosphoribosylaminopyrimidine deaminase/5-amino-6-(5-phosphoribosylamino)uracil reductase